MTTATTERFQQNTRCDASGCWNWNGYIKKDGYGLMRGDEGKTVLAHRFAYTLIVGEIGEKLEVDHLCHNRACVNPMHMEVVTHAENMRRSGPATKTHCKHDHEFTEANTYRRADGLRSCRTCHRIRVAKASS